MLVTQEDREAIQWFLNKLMVDRGKTPTKAYPYGWGTIITAGEIIKAWSVAYDRNLWASEKGISKQAMAQRVKTWVSLLGVNSPNREDAHWAANTIRMKYEDYVPGAVPYGYVANDTPPIVAPIVAPIKPPVPESVNDLDALRGLAKVFRDFCCDSGDKELLVIMERTELELLRLLADRL